MKKLLLGISALVISTAGASAADMAVKAQPLPPAPIMSWTGCYVGVNGGGAWSDGPSMTYVDLAAGSTSTPTPRRPSTRHRPVGS